MPVVSLNMYLTLTFAVVVLFLGEYLKNKIAFLQKFCIPVPVVGGLVFAVVSLCIHSLGILELCFDETLKTVCMIAFFTSVGFQANFKMLGSGGKGLIILLVAVLIVVLAQNGIAIGLAKVMGLSSLVGLCTGSIPMIGGHGTSAAFGVLLEQLGMKSAVTFCTASATFGVVMGSLFGGPIARMLIERNGLFSATMEQQSGGIVQQKVNVFKKHHMTPAVCFVVLSMGIGSLLSHLLVRMGLTFPAYIGGLIVAVIIRNVWEFSGQSFPLYVDEISEMGNICLSLFLGVAMITMKLWQLSSLAVPFLVLLVAQVVFMAAFVPLVVFRALGSDYDAAVICAGFFGFGLGATPNAMANMQSVSELYGASHKAYFLVPLVGAMFVDVINSLVLTVILNMVA